MDMGIGEESARRALKVSIIWEAKCCAKVSDLILLPQRNGNDIHKATNDGECSSTCSPSLRSIGCDTCRYTAIELSSGVARLLFSITWVLEAFSTGNRKK